MTVGTSSSWSAITGLLPSNAASWQQESMWLCLCEKCMVLFIAKRLSLDTSWVRPNTTAVAVCSKSEPMNGVSHLWHFMALLWCPFLTIRRSLGDSVKITNSRALAPSCTWSRQASNEFCTIRPATTPRPPKAASRRLKTLSCRMAGLGFLAFQATSQISKAPMATTYNQCIYK